MMPNLTTNVELRPLPFSVDFTTGIVSLGSCFSDEIGIRLKEGGFSVEQNPFGTLYNPASIASALRRIMQDREIGPEDLVEHEGLWHSWHHHGSFSRPTAAECLEVCNSRIHQAHQALKEASLLTVTFGTVWIFELKSETLDVVANCHKLPADTFVRRRMGVDEIVALWQPLLEELSSFNPRLTTLFTVSPIRHVGDGLHGNQLSKATLLLAVEKIMSTFNFQFSAPTYFPAYEIVLDELRDYRFYDADMAHPSQLAVDIVWDHFQQVAMSPAVREQARLNAKQAKRGRHIPLHSRNQ